MKSINAELQVFDSPSEAEDAVRALNRYGFDVTQLSLLRKASGSGDPLTGSYAVSVSTIGWASRDLWGTVWGMVTAPVVFFLPGLGLVALAGPGGGALMAAHQRALLASGVAVLDAALMQLGVPRVQLASYNAALQADKFVLLMHGTASEVVHAQQLVAFPNPLHRPKLKRPSPSERLS